MSTISEYIGVALASTIKFAGGPLAGVVMQLSWLETTISSTVGMMFTVLLITYGSNFVEKITSPFFSKSPKKVFKKSTRIAVKVKQKLGLWGVAFLTPFLFTPILGTFIALSFRYPKAQIAQKMLICGLVAGFIQTLAFHFLGGIFNFV
jgi:hypothetical protein